MSGTPCMHVFEILVRPNIQITTLKHEAQDSRALYATSAMHVNLLERGST